MPRSQKGSSTIKYLLFIYDKKAFWVTIVPNFKQFILKKEGLSLTKPIWSGETMSGKIFYRRWATYRDLKKMHMNYKFQEMLMTKTIFYPCLYFQSPYHYTTADKILPEIRFAESDLEFSLSDQTSVCLCLHLECCSLFTPVGDGVKSLLKRKKGALSPYHHLPVFTYFIVLC